MFWMAGDFVCYQAAYFSGATNTWRTALLVGGLLGLGLAVGAYRSRRGMTADELDAISENLPTSLTCGELERLYPAYSAELHSKMRTRIAELMVRGDA